MGCDPRIDNESHWLSEKNILGIPALGVAKLEKARVNISATLEIMENATTDALRAIQEEVSPLSKAVLQNRMALDRLTAKEGGVCTVINQSRCAYSKKDLRIERD